MKYFLDFKRKRLLPILLSGIAIVCALVAVIVYGATGVTNYTANKLNSAVIVFSIAGMLISVASIIFDLKLVKHAAFLCFMVATLQYFVFEIDYIGSVLVGIDNTPVTAPFVVTALLFITTMIVSLVCAIITKDPLEIFAEEEKAV